MYNVRMYVCMYIIYVCTYIMGLNIGTYVDMYVCVLNKNVL